ncbi:HAD family hydrolase [Streptomyces sp. NPDC059637]|uniref:HAD family hydrolase n=1 Tax=Streptomyces sp. NPDC059637 TaxID=3347752 RepID=UPI003690BFBA
MTAPGAEGPPHAVLLDLDGTLVDSVRGDFLACSALFSEHGRALPADRWAAEVCGRPAGYPDLLAELPGPVEGHLARLRELWEVHMHPGNVVLLPGAPELLDRLTRAGMPLALVSASDRPWVETWLAEYGLAGHFTAVVPGDEVTRRKPAPDLHLEAARRLGVAPARCLAVEDSVTGVAAARAAGARVAAVPTALTRHLDYGAAHHVLGGLAEVAPLAGLPAAQDPPTAPGATRHTAAPAPGTRRSGDVPATGAGRE